MRSRSDAFDERGRAYSRPPWQASAVPSRDGAAALSRAAQAPAKMEGKVERQASKNSTANTQEPENAQVKDPLAVITRRLLPEHAGRACL